jgi:hypothetical protein
MNTLESIEKTRGLVKHLIFKLFKNSYEGGKESYNSSQENRPMKIEAVIALFKAGFFLCIVLAIVGSEAVKVIMRKNYGARGVDLVFLWISIVIFFIVGVMGLVSTTLFIDSIEDRGGLFKNNYFFVVSGLIAACFYFILSYLLIKKAILIKRIRKIDTSFYEGDSKYLDGLIISGWKENTVKNVSEPFLVICIGIFLASFLTFFCLPIIFCGISIWVRQLAIKFSNYNTVRDVYNTLQYGSGTSEYHVVN